MVLGKSRPRKASHRNNGCSNSSNCRRCKTIRFAAARYVETRTKKCVGDDVQTVARTAALAFA